MTRKRDVIGRSPFLPDVKEGLPSPLESELERTVVGISVLSPGSASRVEAGQPAGMFLLIAATSAGSVVLPCNCKRRRSTVIINCKCASQLILNQTKES